MPDVETKLCPRCHKAIPKAAQVCIKCGADLRGSKLMWALAVASTILALFTVWMMTRG
jgi:predicted amidophosphoribosyltransferase